MKQPKLQTIPSQRGSVLYLTHNHEKEVIYDDYWHFHSEFEIAYIPRGKGRRFIGNKISHYEDGDLVLLGPKIPHNTFYYAYESTDYEEYVIQFKTEDILQICYGFPEFHMVSKLLENSTKGLFFSGTEKHKFGNLVKKIFTMEPYDRLIHFFNLLNGMSYSKTHSSLDAVSYLKTSKTDSKRLRQVYALINNNYKEPINTYEVAAELGLTESSFCRFFKKSTGKTFKQALIEVRVNEACSLLANTNMQIGAIGLETGFSNVPLFNRMFKKLIGENPSDYRERFKK